MENKTPKSETVYTEATINNTTQFLNLINDNTRFNELKTAFEIYDKNFDGLINDYELGNIMKSLGHENSETELEDMITDVCQNKDKLINFDEFMLLMNKRGKEYELLDEYTEAFRVFDREGNGRINIVELRQILIALGDGVKEDDVDYMLKDADVDDDGFIQYRKFVKLMLTK